MSYKINTAVVGFGIGHFISITTGLPVTTGVPVCKRTLDGTGGACANAAAYNSAGAAWEIDLATGDMNGTNVILSFELTGCVSISYTLQTVTKLVSELNDIAATAIVTNGAITTSTGAVSLVESVTDGAKSAKQDTMETTLDAVFEDTDDTIPAQITALNDFDPVNDAVANVTLVATTTTNTDMVGTDNAATETKQDAGDIVTSRISAIQEADKIIDFPNGTLTYNTKGTSNALLTKDLKDPDGAAVDSTEDVIAAEENV